MLAEAMLDERPLFVTLWSATLKSCRAHVTRLTNERKLQMRCLR